MKNLKKLFASLLCMLLVIAMLMPTGIALALEKQVPIAEENAENVCEIEDSYGNRSLLMKIGSQNVVITENGVTQNMTIETMPLVKNSRTLVPMRFICEAVLECKVVYVPETKSAILEREDMQVLVDLYDNQVEIEYADGTIEYAEMDQKPVIKNNYTYMPLRFFSELFGCSVKYNSNDQSILITSGGNADIELNPEPEPVDRPDVSVKLPEYTVGQPTYSYTDFSYDKNGLDLEEHQWKLTVNGANYSDTDINVLLKKINKAGSYDIYCRVKNSDDVWSMWEKFTLTVKNSKDPVITDFKAVRADNGSKTIRSGDKLDFTYDLDNEDWETIVYEEWRYTWNSYGFNKNMEGKPQALYYLPSGYYTVTLKVKDSAGKWGTAVTTVKPKQYNKPQEALLKFNSLIPGEIYQNSTAFNFNEVKTAEPKNIVFDDVTLLASNNPESVETVGILAADKISGDARLRFHHKNCTGSSAKFYVVAKNETTTPVTLTIGTRAAAGPSTGVLQVGVSVVERYMLGGYKKVTKVLQPGEIYLVNQGAPKVADGSSVAGLIDVSSNGELKYSICCMRSDSSYKNYEYLMPAVKNSTHIRGTFEQSTVSMDYTFSGKTLEKIILGREDAFEGYYCTGRDGLTGEDVINKGNRGVVHKMTVTADKKVGLLFNPRGTAYVGVIMIDGKIVDLSVAGMMKGISEACILDVMEAGETKEITYVVPSGSDSPVLIVAIPESQWKNY